MSQFVAEREEASGTREARIRGLRVLHVGKFYPPHKGGMETHLRDLCERLTREADVRVVVASSDRRTSTEETIAGVRVRREGTLVSLGASPVCPGIVRQIRESRADIVHLHFPNPAAILAYLASGHAGRVVVTYHSDIVRQKLTARAFRPVLYHFLRRCSAIIATSPDYIESSTALRRFRDLCRVIPLGIATEKFDRVDAEAVRRIREQHGPRIVLGVGRLIYYKGFEHLVRAMREVEGRLLIIGDGPLKGELERERAALGSLRERVVLLGEVANAVPYFQAAEVFALASIARSEAFGIVQLEAMASGVPVVNTRLASGVPFVSPDDVSGITVPPADAPALASALNRLLGDPTLRARLGTAGKRRVRDEFTADLMAERTLRLYREVLDSPVP